MRVLFFLGHPVYCTLCSLSNCRNAVRVICISKLSGIFYLLCIIQISQRVFSISGRNSFSCINSTWRDLNWLLVCQIQLIKSVLKIGLFILNSLNFCGTLSREIVVTWHISYSAKNSLVDFRQLKILLKYKFKI